MGIIDLPVLLLLPPLLLLCCRVVAILRGKRICYGAKWWLACLVFCLAHLGPHRGRGGVRPCISLLLLCLSRPTAFLVSQGLSLFLCSICQNDYIPIHPTSLILTEKPEMVRTDLRAGKGGVGYMCFQAMTCCVAPWCRQTSYHSFDPRVAWPLPSRLPGQQESKVGAGSDGVASAYRRRVWFVYLLLLSTVV